MSIFTDNWVICFPVKRKIQELEKIRKNENKRKFWARKYKGFYVICPNPDCKIPPYFQVSRRFRTPLYLPARYRLQDKIYSCSICKKTFRVLDVLDEETDLFGAGWVRFKRWFRFWGWKKSVEKILPWYE